MTFERVKEIEMNLSTAEFMVREQVADRLREADQARRLRAARLAPQAGADAPVDRLRRPLTRPAPAI